MKAQYELKVIKPHIDPCSENWENMLPYEKGAFCESCNKAVHDLSNLNAEQLAAFSLAHQREAICARIAAELNDKPIITLKRLPQQYSYAHIFMLMLFFVFGTTLFSCEEKEHAIIKSKIENTFFDNFAVERTTQEKPLENHLKNATQIKVISNTEDIVNADTLNIMLDAVLIKSSINIDGQNNNNSTNVTHTSGIFSIEVVLKKEIVQNIAKKEITQENLVEKIKLNVYPNPALFNVTLAYNLILEDATTLSIFNMQGAKITDIFSSNSVIPGPYTSQYNVQNLTAGMYIAILVNGNNKEIFKFNVVH